MTAPRIVACHEAGHAVVAYRSGNNGGGEVSIVGDGIGTLGYQKELYADSTSAADAESMIVTLYAGGHAQRLAEATSGDEGCEVDESQAQALLKFWRWEARESEFRERSSDLVRRHWPEILAVAQELEAVLVLDGDEVEILADAAAGVAGADLAEYRRSNSQLETWRHRNIVGRC